MLGYSSAPVFDKHYKTIRVPIFKNMISGERGMEFDLTQALVAEIQKRTPYRVVQCDADLELSGKIMSVLKQVNLPSPENTVRSANITLTVEVVLKDLRTGKILSQAPRRPGIVTPEEVPGLKDNQALQNLTPMTGAPAAPGSMDANGTMMGQPGQPAQPAQPSLAGTPVPTFGSEEPVDIKKNPPGLSIHATGTFVPEMGQSTTSGKQSAVNTMARQIVDMMEMGW